MLDGVQPDDLILGVHPEDGQLLEGDEEDDGGEGVVDEEGGAADAVPRQRGEGGGGAGGQEAVLAEDGRGQEADEALKDNYRIYLE